MKKPFSWMVLLFFGAIILTMQHCTDDGETAGPEKIQFTLSLSEVGSDGGRSQITEIPATLELSVTTVSGTSIFDRKRIPLIRTGDGFLTEPLELPPASYRITHFMLLSEIGNVVYVTPFQGSPLGKAVNTPLPHPFAVSKNNVSNITMQVIDLDAWLPQDFGYASFPITPVNPLSIAVFIPKNNGHVLASAKAYVVEGDDTVKQYNLGATINLISFPGDPVVTRKLIVTKAGYNTMTKEFAYDSLAQALQGLPLKIMLVPSLFTITPFLEGEAGHVFQMFLDGLPGNLMIDWGDGASEPFELMEAEAMARHEYAAVGNYVINVTGDLHKIIGFSRYGNSGEMDAVNLQGLTGLGGIALGWIPHGPKVIDVSQSPGLFHINIANLPRLESVILHEHNAITWLDISGLNSINTANVDAIIAQLHRSVVAHNRGGQVMIANHYFLHTQEMVGPPSPQGMTRLRELRDSYGWRIIPDPL